MPISKCLHNIKTRNTYRDSFFILPNFTPPLQIIKAFRGARIKKVQIIKRNNNKVIRIMLLEHN